MSPAESAEKRHFEEPACVNLVNVFTVPQARLRRHVGTLGADKMTAVCHPLAIAVGCD